MLKFIVVDPQKKQAGTLPRNVQEVNDITNCDCLLVYGGDGTLLSTFRQMALSGVDFNTTVLAGLNRGTLGFMANDVDEGIFINNVCTAIEHIRHGGTSTDIQHRALLKVSVVVNNTTQVHYALNEVSLHPTAIGKLFETNVHTVVTGNRQQVLHYKGDGLIISTASGSTAYNLSANGPILMPDNKSIILSPICPFSLASRPVVISETNVLRVTTVQNARIVVDGTPLDIVGTADITVSVAKKTLMLYKSDAFFDTITYKLGWNHSIK